MFICERCGNICEELNTYKENYRTYDGEYVGTEEFAETCHCGGEFVEAKLCPICKSVYINSEKESICTNCIEDGMTYENAVEMGEKYTKPVELNGFWASVFDTEEIEEVLKKTFDEMPPEFQKRYVQEYCENEEFDYISFLEEKEKEC